MSSWNINKCCDKSIFMSSSSLYREGFRLVFYRERRVTGLLFVRPTEGEGEGGSAALSVCPQKVSTRRLQRGPQDIQGTQSIALPQPVPMSEENKRKSEEDEKRPKCHALRHLFTYFWWCSIVFFCSISSGLWDGWGICYEGTRAETKIIWGILCQGARQA